MAPQPTLVAQVDIYAVVEEEIDCGDVRGIAGGCASATASGSRARQVAAGRCSDDRGAAGRRSPSSQTNVFGPATPLLKQGLGPARPRTNRMMQLDPPPTVYEEPPPGGPPALEAAGHGRH